MFRPLFRYHRTHRFVLRDLGERPDKEVKETLGNAATEVEARLRYCVHRYHGCVPENWFGSIERHQLLGCGKDIPDLVSYSYLGKRFLTLWTRVSDGDLVIDLRAVTHHKRSPPRGLQQIGPTGGVPFVGRETRGLRKNS